MVASASQESFVVEGSAGSSKTNINSLGDVPIGLDGKTASIRFHTTVSWTAKKIVAFTVSSHFYDGKFDGPADDQVQLLSYTSFGLGASYRYYSLILGGEYELAAFRQSAIGPGSGVLNYNVGLPHVYGGILHRLGNLGIGLTYSYKRAELTSQQTRLSGNRVFEDKTVLLSLTYHFDGTKKFLIRSLFIGDEH